MSKLLHLYILALLLVLNLGCVSGDSANSESNEELTTIELIIEESSLIASSNDFDIEDLSNYFYFELIELTDNLIEVNLILDGYVETCGFNIQLKYNSSKLLIDRYNQNISNINFNTNSDNIIQLNYINSNFNLKNKTIISSFIFEIVEKGLIILEIDILEIIKLDSNRFDIIQAEYNIMNSYYVNN